MSYYSRNFAKMTKNKTVKPSINLTVLSSSTLSNPLTQSNSVMIKSYLAWKNPPPPTISDLKRLDFDDTERKLLKAEAELERARANRDMYLTRLERLRHDIC